MQSKMERSIGSAVSMRSNTNSPPSCAATATAALISPLLGWDDAEAARRAADYVALTTTEREAPHLPEVALDAALGA